MLFKYIVSTKQGAIKKGEIEAENREGAIKALLMHDFILISLKSKKKIKLFDFSFGPVTALDKINLVRHLAMMTKSGLSLRESFKIAEEQTISRRLKKILKEVGKKIEEGETLSSAFSSYPRIFSPIFLGLIKVGETSGTLEQCFFYLIVQLEKDYDLKKKVQTALLYPAIVLIFATTIGFGLAFFLFPKLLTLFRGLDIPLPIITRVFLGAVTFFSQNAFYIFGGLLAFIFIFIFFSRYKKTQPFFHRLYLVLPFLSSLIRKKNLANFSRMMSTLLKSGLTMSQSLEIVVKIINNAVYQKRIKEIIPFIQEGKTLSFNLEKFPKEFPLIFSKTINVGEKTGNLDESFLYLADFYEGDVDRNIRNLNTILEPVLLIIVGLGIGLLAVAIILPIYQFIGQISR